MDNNQNIVTVQTAVISEQLQNMLHMQHEGERLYGTGEKKIARWHTEF